MPKGGHQEQVQAAISYPIPTGTKEYKVVYLNETQVLEPGTVEGCNGSNQEPSAEPGYLCVYQGDTAQLGTLKSEWTGAKWIELTDPSGNQDASEEGVAGTEGGEIGEMVVYRTNTFTETPNKSLPAEASLNAAGAWALTAK